MYQLERSMYTETAHMLREHPGDCSYIHGHSYKWTVVLESEHLKGGMVMDFTALKEAMNIVIGVPFDHALVLDKASMKEYNKYIGKVAEHNKNRILVLPTRPTAEVMAKYVHYSIKRYMPHGVSVKSVTCRETENNSATYYEK